jgi:hypothetical protein
MKKVQMLQFATKNEPSAPLTTAEIAAIVAACALVTQLVRVLVL